MKIYCRGCGDTISLSKERKELIEDGYMELPELCSDCSAEPEYDMSHEIFSDADPGL